MPNDINWHSKEGPPLATDTLALPFSKLLIATQEYRYDLVNSERAELQYLLANTPDVIDGYGSPTSTKFVPGAPLSPITYEFTSERHFIETAIKQLKDLSIDTPPLQNKSPATTHIASPDYYFYQSSDGQHVYLHPLEIKMLKHAFGDYASFPNELNVIATRVIESSVNEELRSRWKYLDHLPLKCDINFCHADLKQIVPKQTLLHFQRNLKNT